MSIFENQAIEIEKSCTKNNGGMKMKALASDFDRTLFFYDESGSYYRLEDVQAIKHFQSLGNLFGVCTGRSYKGIEDFNPHQIDYDFYILCSGAKILDKEGNLIYQKFIDKKIDIFKKLGFKIKKGKHLYDSYGYLAGTDKDRADDLNSMFADKEVDAIVCLRGGYGSIRMVSYLDLKLIKSNPKPLCGYSDITLLLN